MTDLRHRGATEKELQHQHSEDKVSYQIKRQMWRAVCCCGGYHMSYMLSYMEKKKTVNLLVMFLDPPC